MVDPQAAGWLGLGVAAGFLLDWAAVGLGWKAVKPFTKPLAMLMVILWTAWRSPAGISLAVGWLLAAQAFGLLGDILLLFPEKAFSLGLGAFLMGHIIYLGLLISVLPGLWVGSISFFVPLGWILVGLVCWSAILILIYRLFKPLPGQKGVTKWLWVAIQAYSWILSAMAALTLVAGLQSSGPIPGRVALPLGALLFLVSDSMLTYNRFIQPFDQAQLWVRITYHLAQFSLAWGFLAMLG